MAWKEYSQLSKEDKRHEDVRQKMIVCQSQMERAVEIVDDIQYLRSDNSEKQIKEKDYVNYVKKIASELVDWVYEKANETGKSNNIPPVLPEPTLQQKKVLDAIAYEIYGTNPYQELDIKTKVLDAAERLCGKRVYPSKMESVDKIVKEIKGE